MRNDIFSAYLKPHSAMNKCLHIIAFDMPDPPDYGGVIDIYFKIRALKETGVQVILHVFLYDGKTPSAELEKLCKKVYYYPRRRFKNPFSGDIPYIVATRSDETLLRNLCKDDHPILFEGLHTTAFLAAPELKDRLRMVRTHNVEHVYYRALEEAETSFFKKYFFRIEAERLENYESTLSHASLILPISPLETEYYAGKFAQTHYLPAFHSNDEVMSKPGRGKYVLYHGNLGIGENNKAALYLVHEVFSRLQVPCVIAGNNPSRQLQTAVKGNPYINLAAGISSVDILQMVQDAHINILVTFQNTGIKLKLLNSLHRGRFCVTNDLMVSNTGLEDLCLSRSNPGDLADAVMECWEREFTPEMVAERTAGLSRQFSNMENAGLLASFL